MHTYTDALCTICTMYHVRLLRSTLIAHVLCAVCNVELCTMCCLYYIHYTKCNVQFSDVLCPVVTSFAY